MFNFNLITPQPIRIIHLYSLLQHNNVCTILRYLIKGELVINITKKISIQKFDIRELALFEEKVVCRFEFLYIFLKLSFLTWMIVLWTAWFSKITTQREVFHIGVLSTSTQTLSAKKGRNKAVSLCDKSSFSCSLTYSLRS